MRGGEGEGWWVRPWEGMRHACRCEGSGFSGLLGGGGADVGEAAQGREESAPSSLSHLCSLAT